MGNLDLDISFKQTTSEKVKCKMCHNSVAGEKGYIKFNLYVWGGRYEHNTDKRIVICMSCFKDWLNEINKAEDNRTETYNRLVKTKILKSLK